MKHHRITSCLPIRGGGGHASVRLVSELPMENTQPGGVPAKGGKLGVVLTAAPVLVIIS